jgi:hypothetical protein
MPGYGPAQDGRALELVELPHHGLKQGPVRRESPPHGCWDGSPRQVLFCGKQRRRPASEVIISTRRSSITEDELQQRACICRPTGVTEAQSMCTGKGISQF